jgi:dienelactone hydrolase
VCFRIEPTVFVLLIVFALPPLGSPGTHAARAAEPAPGAAPLRDARLTELRHLDRRYPWTPPASRAAWERRAGELRRHILVSAGLWPLPARTPLRPQIFGRVERSGYTVEKVYFESHAGLFVTGNLYRPLGKRGPFPVVLNPHGHWTYGRLEATDNCSGPELGASLARQGAIVFAWDMIGYTDSVQLSHDLGGAREALWGISLAGLQLWNALRAVDFVAGLPDADAEGIACTGASGGGTQTFLLAAIEPRISVAVPVNMVSSRMQGGCLCENPPLLRRDTFNVELAALVAPRPLMLVAATGDWTAETPSVELPALRDVYRLYDAEARLAAYQQVAPHNYNRASREAVYRFLARWLFGRTDGVDPTDAGGTPPKLNELLVFHGRSLPAGARTEATLTADLIATSERQIATALAARPADLAALRAGPGAALLGALGASRPAQVSAEPAEASSDGPSRLVLTRAGVGDRVPAAEWPAKGPSRGVTLIVHGDGQRAVDPGLVAALQQGGQRVVAIDAFRTGALGGPWPERAKVKYFETYNPSETGSRVQDVLTAASWAAREGGRVNAIGAGRAGLWLLLARAVAPELFAAVAADAAGFDDGKDESFVQDLFVPGLRRAGDLRVAGALGAPGPLLLHGTAGKLRAGAAIAAYYRAMGAARAFIERRAPADLATLVRFVGAPGNVALGR